MKVGDTVRIGGIPVVLVADVGGAPCDKCVFDNACNIINRPAHEAVVDWERRMGNDCILGNYHYEVQV